VIERLYHGSLNLCLNLLYKKRRRNILGGIEVSAGLKNATLEIVVTRADGTVEDYGIVAEYDREKEEAEAVRLLALQEKADSSYLNRLRNLLRIN
jgi:hypothetical protein